MSTIVVGAILIGIITGITWVLVAQSKKQTNRRKQQLMNEFSRIGAAHDLSFTAQEILKNQVIGLDGIRRKIVVVEEKENKFSHFIIDVNEVKDCTLQKNSFSIPAQAKNDSNEVYLNKISLQFDFKKPMQPQATIVFYDNVQNHVYEILELETKAKEWRSVVTKLITQKSLAVPG
jgi:hypothetical protein